MRSIKIKVWDTKEKKFLTKTPQVELIHKEKSWANEFYLEIDEDWFAEDYDPTRYIFLESTGLKDKNGVEIYEGDILRTGGGKGVKQVVKWIESASYTGFNIGKGKAHYLYVTRITKKVIGNIYKNKELL